MEVVFVIHLWKENISYVRNTRWQFQRLQHELLIHCFPASLRWEIQYEPNSKLESKTWSLWKNVKKSLKHNKDDVILYSKDCIARLTKRLPFSHCFLQLSHSTAERAEGLWLKTSRGKFKILVMDKKEINLMCKARTLALVQLKS